MGFRAKLKRLQRASREHLGSIDLADGSVHYYDPMRGEVFIHCMDCAKAEYAGEPWPDPPPILKALTRARNRRAALQTFENYNDFFPYDEDALVERGELVPRRLIAQ
jgi:hypothetical protein